MSNKVFVAPAIPTIFTIHRPKNHERLSPTFVNNLSFFIICASEYPRIISASSHFMAPVPSIIGISFVMELLPKKSLGIPIGVNQILFGVLVMKSVIPFFIDGLLMLFVNILFCPFPIFAKFQKKVRNTIVIITGAKRDIQFLFLG